MYADTMGDARARLLEQRSASAPGSGGDADFFGCRYGSGAASLDEDFGNVSSGSSSSALEPERPRYLWEHIPPRLAPAAGVSSDLLDLGGDDEDCDVDVEEDHDASAGWSWDMPTMRKENSVSVSICAGAPPAQARVEDHHPERRPLHHSGGGLAVTARTAATAPRIDIGLPASEPCGAGSSIHLQISGCPTSVLTVSVSTQPQRPTATKSCRPQRSTRHQLPEVPEEVVESDEKALERALRLLRESGWYHGALSWQQAQVALQDTPEGTFLARDSLHRRYVFALSVQTAHGPTSVRVQLHKGRFRLDAPGALLEDMPSFPDVTSLVEHYARRGPVSVDGFPQLTMRLRQPLMRQVPSLAHCCRLALHGAGASRPAVTLPAAVRSYLDDYPYSR